ncbi:MAG: hypothetical protein HC796_03505 [Synechococcaceae cyanobacterium RL_1_2]|nr:hypothetical protein [Synechococcaceae cyanobacterium RL_1_2]
MNHIRKYSMALLLLMALAISLKMDVFAQKSASITNPIAAMNDGDRSWTARPQQQTLSAANLLKVDLYRVNSECNGFEAVVKDLPTETAMDAAIEETLAYTTNGDFEIAGYRLKTVDSIATIDLRLPPDSPRTFLSLAPCEAYTILGSLRETLIKMRSLVLVGLILPIKGKRFLSSIIDYFPKGYG